MATNISRVLIVSQAVRLRDSLRVLLKSCYPLTAIEEAGFLPPPVALQFIANEPQSLILLDAALPNGQAWQVLEQVGTDLSRQRCVILAHSLEHQKQAQSLGALVILLDGLTAESIFAAVEAGVQS
jgi:DNA-binding NarL/FixJ family response regulator